MNKMYRFSYKINNAIVDPDKIREIEEFFQDDYAFENGSPLSFQNVTFVVNDSKSENVTHLIDINLSLDVYDPRGDYIYSYFLEAKLFALKLSKALTRGSVELYFIGDDITDSWGLEIEPGIVYRMYIDWQIDDEVKPIDLSKEELLKAVGYIKA